MANSAAAPTGPAASAPAVDPKTLPVPDFSGAEYDTARQEAMAKWKVSEDAAVEMLRSGWEQSVRALCAQWDAAQASLPKDANPTPTSSSTKRGPISFDNVRALPSVLRHQVARYAEQQIEKRMYVPLYYFTDAGRAAATAQNANATTTSEIKLRDSGTDGFALTNGPTAPQLRSFIPDRQLSLEQLRQAGYALIEAIASHGWGEKAEDMFIGFFTSIDSHPLRDLCPEALTLYAERTRMYWHQRYQQDEVVDISRVNDQVLEICRTEIVTARHQKMEADIQARLVRPFLSPFSLVLMVISTPIHVV